jgi:hypothetical protein
VVGTVLVEPQLFDKKDLVYLVLDGGDPGCRGFQLGVVQADCSRPVGVGGLCVSSPVGKFPCRVRLSIKTSKKNT